MKKKVTKKEVVKRTSSNKEFYEIGKSFLFMTVTHYFTGQVVKVLPGELVIKDAAWIADTGRLMNALDTGYFNEVEPINVGEIVISRGAIVSSIPWKHGLPRTQK